MVVACMLSDYDRRYRSRGHKARPPNPNASGFEPRINHMPGGSTDATRHVVSLITFTNLTHVAVVEIHRSLAPSRPCLAVPVPLGELRSIIIRVGALWHEHEDVAVRLVCHHCRGARAAMGRRPELIGRTLSSRCP